jgi:hypothetical protein
MWFRCEGSDPFIPYTPMTFYYISSSTRLLGLTSTVGNASRFALNTTGTSNENH